MVRLSLLSAVVAALSVASVYAAPPNTSIPVASNKPSSGDGSPYRVLQGKYSKSPTMRYAVGGPARPLKTTRALHPLASTAAVSGSKTAMALALDTTGYTDITTLKQYGYMAIAAGRVANVGQWDCGAPCQQPLTAGSVTTAVIDYNANFDAVHAAIIRNDRLKVVVVGFRGSTTITDWIGNIDFAKVDWPLGLSSSFGVPSVHNGFLEGYETAADQIYAAAMKELAAHPDYKLVFTGFSLGAAHATISAIDFQLRDPKLAAKSRVHTYGSPRVGDSDFAKYFNSRGWIVSSRMTAKDDLVVHLPPGWAGFTHVNREYWLQDNGSMKTCSASGTGEDSSCSNSVHFWSYTANDHLNGYWDIRK